MCDLQEKKKKSTTVDSDMTCLENGWDTGWSAYTRNSFSE